MFILVQLASIYKSHSVFLLVERLIIFHGEAKEAFFLNSNLSKFAASTFQPLGSIRVL